MIATLRRWAMLTDEENDRYAPPDTLLLEYDGALWERIIDTEDWILLGTAPRPRSRRGWFVHHLCSGFVMGYPWWKVVLFALTHTGEP